MTGTVPTAAIRQWARDNGLPVGDRGRLTPQLLSAYARSGTSQPKATATATATATAKKTRATAAVPSPRRAVRAVRVYVHPTPGATGIAHKVAARSD